MLDECSRHELIPEGALDSNQPGQGPQQPCFAIVNTVKHTANITYANIKGQMTDFSATAIKHLTVFRQQHEFTRVLRAALSGSDAPAQHLSIVPGAGIPVRKAPACTPRAFQGLVRPSCCADCIGTDVD